MINETVSKLHICYFTRHLYMILFLSMSLLNYLAGPLHFQRASEIQICPGRRISL